MNTCVEDMFAFLMEAIYDKNSNKREVYNLINTPSNIAHVNRHLCNVSFNSCFVLFFVCLLFVVVVLVLI